MVFAFPGVSVDFGWKTGGKIIFSHLFFLFLKSLSADSWSVKNFGQNVTHSMCYLVFFLGLETEKSKNSGFFWLFLNIRKFSKKNEFLENWTSHFSYSRRLHLDARYSSCVEVRYIKEQIRRKFSANSSTFIRIIIFTNRNSDLFTFEEKLSPNFHHIVHQKHLASRFWHFAAGNP